MAQSSLDQFETEPDIFYSGSYTDGLYMGSLGDTRGRFLVAAASSGSNELLYANHFSDYLDLSGSNRSRNLGIARRFRNYFSSVERYQDTILPDPFSSFLLNGGKTVLASGEMGLNPIIVNEADAYVFAPGNQAVGKLVFTTFGTTASYDSGIEISDQVWFSTFPFQGRYKDIQRMIDQGFYRANVLVSITESQYSFDNYYHYGPWTTSNPTSSLATIEILTPRIGWKDGLPGGAANSEPFRFTLMDVTGAVLASEKFGGLGGTVYPPVVSMSFGIGFGTKRPKQKQLTKALFGFGDNYQGVPIINAVTASQIQSVAGTPLGVINGYYASSIDIRGWKYGVVNGFPYYTSCVFRSSRYGQFRDMLEQRKLTKFFDPNGFTVNGKNNGKKGSSSAAVLVAFVSGSDAYVTSSSPTTLNANDSGIYDFEYKSGQPWHDL